MDRERVDRVAEALRRAGCAALVCRLPESVVMLTGYQPILGNSFCVASLTGKGKLEYRLAVPSDEADLVLSNIAARVETFAEETMTRIEDTPTAAREPLRKLLRDANLESGAVVGYEGGHAPVATAYTQVGIPGAATHALLRDLLPDAELRDASALLDELAACKTEAEVAAIRRCEAVAMHGFEAARAAIHIDVSEAEVAAATYAALLRAGYAATGTRHVTPHIHVMAGARSALAYRAYNLTSDYRIRPHDPVMVQMEVGIDGYWAELTRTFFAGEVSEEWRRAHETCLQAQEAALHVIRAGIGGKEADEAARNVMRAAGFGDAFKHGLGHGFGFQAINHGAEPILHPASASVLRAGMTHNMEPAVYLDGVGGIRLNDNVAVLADGNELLSADLPYTLEWLVVSG